MKNFNNDKNKLFDAAIKASGGSIDKSALTSAVNGDMSALMSSLDGETRKKLNAALSDSNKAKQILNSKAAQKILDELLNGGKENG